MSGLREFDDLIAQKVMGWEIWQNDWYTPWIAEDQARHFRYYHGSWSPTTSAACSQLVWIACLKKAYETGYELTQRVDERSFKINADHVSAIRFLIRDLDLNMAICRIAAALFGFEPPKPYAHDPVPPPPPPYALYDVRGRCWIGNDAGVKTYDAWDDARCAATIIGEQIKRLLRPAHYDGSANKLKDQVQTHMTAEEAVIKLEGKKE